MDKLGRYINLLVRVFSETYKSEIGSANAEKLRGEAITKKLVKLFRAQRKDDYQEAKRAVEEKTDQEILLMLSDASLRAPLSTESYEEMKRLCIKFFPKEAREIFKGERVDIEECRSFRRYTGLPEIKEEVNG